MGMDGKGGGGSENKAGSVDQDGWTSWMEEMNEECHQWEGGHLEGWAGRASPLPLPFLCPLTPRPHTDSPTPTPILALGLSHLVGALPPHTHTHTPPSHPLPLAPCYVPTTSMVLVLHTHTAPPASLSLCLHLLLSALTSPSHISSPSLLIHLSLLYTIMEWRMGVKTRQHEMEKEEEGMRWRQAYTTHRATVRRGRGSKHARTHSFTPPHLSFPFVEEEGALNLPFLYATLSLSLYSLLQFLSLYLSIQLLTPNILHTHPFAGG